MVHQGEAADRYGVSQQQISKDLDRIAEFVGDRLGARHELTIDAVFQRSIQGLLEEGDYRKAAQTAKEYDEWVTDRTDLEEMQDQLEFLEQAHREQEP
jgi:predicted transcriptional regulator